MVRMARRSNSRGRTMTELMAVDEKFQRVEDIGCESALLELSKYGEPFLTQSTALRGGSFWRCRVDLSVKMDGVKMEIASDKGQAPSDAVRSCLARCQKAIEEIKKSL